MVVQLAMFMMCALPSCKPAGPPRDNRLRNLMGDVPPPGLSLASKKRAVDFGAASMKIFSILGTHGLAREEVLKSAHAKELLPLIAPFETGTTPEQHVFKLGEKVYRALAYVGEQVRTNGNWPDSDLNTLLRIHPPGGAMPGAREVTEGVGEVLLDYAQIVDPLGFNAAQALTKK